MTTAAGIFLVALGPVAAIVLHAYDSNGWAMAAALNGAAAIMSFLLIYSGLSVFQVSRGPRRTAAILGLVPWNTFLLSQLPYVGFFFIPLEILASGFIIRSSARLERAWPGFAIAAVVRLLVQLAIYGLRPVARALFH